MEASRVSIRMITFVVLSGSRDESVPPAHVHFSLDSLMLDSTLVGSAEPTFPSEPPLHLSSFVCLGLYCQEGSEVEKSVVENPRRRCFGVYLPPLFATPHIFTE